VETGITETQIYNSQKETGQTRKSINIKGLLLEHVNIYNSWDILKQLKESGPIGKKEVEKFNSYYKQPHPKFKENSIMTIRYNPQKATVEYWTDNNKVNFISEIYVFHPYFSKFFIRLYNCSIRFLCIINIPQSEDLNKLIPLKVFPIEDEIVKLDINNYKNPLGFKIKDSSFKSLQNILKFESKDNIFLDDSQIKMYEEILLNNPLDDMGIREVYFDPIRVSMKYGKLISSLPK
jgi:hypothetical protein